MTFLLDDKFKNRHYLPRCMISRRTFLQAGSAAVAWETLNIKTDLVMAASNLASDTSELHGMDALRWYAHQQMVADPGSGLEAESRDFGTFPFKANGARIYNKDIYLVADRPDFGHMLHMAYDDSNGLRCSIGDAWIKGHILGDSDYVYVWGKIGDSHEHCMWYGYGGYRLLRYRPLGKDEEPSPQFEIDEEPYFTPVGQIVERVTSYSQSNVIEGVASYSINRGPLLTGVYEGMHQEFLAKRAQIFTEVNTEYRKNLQHIIRELEREGKITL